MREGVSLLFILFSVVHCGEFDFTVEIPAGKFQCYFQPVDYEKHRSMEVDYQVIDGGDLNINFLFLLGAEVLAQENLKTDGSHKIDIKQSGEYQLCFDNSFSYQTKKIVFFEIFLFDVNGQLDDVDLSRIESPQNPEAMKRFEEMGLSLQAFAASSQRIKNELNKMEYHQSLMRAQEARDRAVMGANLDRVTMWSIIHTTVMLTVAAVQVWMIRSLFESNSKIGRLLRN